MENIKCISAVLSGLVIATALINTGCSPEPSVGATSTAPSVNGGQIPGPKENASAAVAASTTKPRVKDVSFNGDFTEANALNALFDKIDPTNASPTWSPEDVCVKESLMRSVPDGDDGEYIDFFLGSLSNPDNKNTVSGHSLLKYQLDGKDFAYFVFETQTAWCIACSALVGASKWERDGDAWKLVNVSKCLAPLGGLGSFGGAVELAQLGPKHYGLLIHSEYEDRRHTLVVVDGPQADLQIAFSKITADGNTQGRSSCLEAELSGIKANCWKYTSKLSFQKGPSADYYDLALDKSGTVDDGGEEATPVSELEIYRFAEGVYAR